MRVSYWYTRVLLCEISITVPLWMFTSKLSLSKLRDSKKRVLRCVCVLEDSICIWFILRITDVIFNISWKHACSLSLCPPPPPPSPSQKSNCLNSSFTQIVRWSKVIRFCVSSFYIFTIYTIWTVFLSIVLFFLIIPLLYVVSPALFSTFRLFIYQITQKIKSSNGRLWGCQTGAKSEHPKVVQNSSFEWVVEWLL